MSRREALPPIDEVFCFMEVWKDIPNYEGYYQVSNLGRLKSLKRKGCSNDRIIKQAADGYGYFIVTLTINNIKKKFSIHKLVAMAFLNHIPNGHKIVVDHINNVRTDNRLENLQIITHRENTSKDRKNGSSKYTGVCWNKCKNKWQSQIIINNKSINLGRFINEIDAHNAYQNALKNLSV